jgi:pimeloyl-ACP methyl ester carboxylesterase
VRAAMRLGLPALVSALVMVGGAGSAAAAGLAPFGHSCTLENGVRFCPTTDLASRPHSFDGTPIDVDVTLPATGSGPFPTILLLHGLGQNKTAFESPTGTVDGAHFDNSFFAEQGYAVVTPTARGFGNSCGNALSRTADCAAGFTRLGDMRYEVRDIQTLVGQLVDEKIVKPNAIGATGVSYGGGFSTMLAFLKNRIRLPNGAYAPWRSPRGTPISLTAAWPRWLWSNGASIFARNGRAPWSRNPVGVAAQAYADVIFAVGESGYTAPLGAPLGEDILLWKQQLDAGRITAGEKRTLNNAFSFHGVAGVPGVPAPLLMQSGWTDGLFPAGQSLGAYDHIRAQNKSAPVSLQLGDLGHSPGANHPGDAAAFDRQGLRFFNAWLKGTGAKPKPGSVTAYTTVCPTAALHGGGPYTASTYQGLARGSLGFGSSKALHISSRGGSVMLAEALSPLAPTGSRCTEHAPDPTSKATISIVSPGVTLIGQPVLTGQVVTKGDNGQLDARLWDLNPKTHLERLADRGAYRLTNNQRGSVRFTLDGDGWRFPKGHRIVVELLGRDAPTYGPSPAKFSATLTNLGVMLSTR